jgi:Na+/H+-translocating membrane pyrophosphatase
MLGNTTLGLIAALGFGFGAVCSALSGYLSMWVAAQSNIRVTSAARINYSEAFVLCFRGGAFSAVLNLTLCILGITSFYSILQLIFVTDTSLIGYRDIPMLLVGYGFGASFVALFMQLGGGIYTKAADVGADLVGKIEQGIPEDDPRNPAVIADLVGDMVGDCVGSSADVFESVAAEIIGAMILGSTLAAEANLEERYVIKFLFFPLVVHAMVSGFKGYYSAYNPCCVHLPTIFLSSCYWILFCRILLSVLLGSPLWEVLANRPITIIQCFNLNGDMLSLSVFPL